MDTEPYAFVTWAMDAAYLAAAFLFIYGLKRMSSPVTARSGIVVAGWGMLVAVLASFLNVATLAPEARPHMVANVALAVIALGIGVGWAWVSGKKVAMTAMPQMVALYNGMGGGAAAAIAAAELYAGKAAGHGVIGMMVTIIGALIGAVSLSGSLIAWAKLDGRINGVWRVKGQQALNGTAMLVTLALGATLVWQATQGVPPVGAGNRPVLRRRADFRRPDDHADRRRRHAGGDLALQRLHRPGGGFRRLRAAEPGADDRRHGGRQRRHALDAFNGPGDEPLGLERHLLQLRGHRRRGAGRDEGYPEGRRRQRRGDQHALCQ